MEEQRAGEYTSKKREQMNKQELDLFFFFQLIKQDPGDPIGEETLLPKTCTRRGRVRGGK
jgi:hypothetical protein